eukprot:GHVU01059166.1.p1 GENE.GHVU01059166.1~~GHVU01059166.1.p1  ORF type:complete len:812 (-),score=65.24 GHVU01059166.1:740-3004(-)
MTPAAWTAEHQRARTTMLLGWFQYNTNRLASDESITRADLPTYLEMPERFTWHLTHHVWNPRACCLRYPTIGRLRNVHQNAGELYYLRLLLLHEEHSRGATSFLQLKTVDGHVNNNFRTACQHLGIVYDESYLRRLMEEVQTFGMPSHMRVFFSILLDTHNPPHVESLFNRFCSSMTEDWSTRDRPLDMPTRRVLLWLDLQAKFNQRGRDFFNFGLSHLVPSLQDVLNVTQRYPEFRRFAPSDIPRVIAEEMLYDTAALENEVADRRLQLTDEQQLIYAYVQSLRSHDPQPEMQENTSPNMPLPSRCVCILAAAGAGKTTLLNLILDTFRRDGCIALAVATTGIAAALLHGGRTFHSRFACPIELSPDMRLNIPWQSPLADLLRKAGVIVWDEISMAHRYCFEALDHCLRDLCRDRHGNPSTLPFAGKIIIVAGDFRQLLPIDLDDNTNGVQVTVKNSPLWHTFHVMHLTRNMRMHLSLDAPADDLQYLEWITAVGNGQLQTVHDDFIDIPERYCAPIDDQAAIQWAFPDFLQHYMDETYLVGKIIMAPKYFIVKRLNELICDSIPEQCLHSLAVDTPHFDMFNPTAFCWSVTPELLSTLDPSNFPPYCLKLKTGMVVMLLRNLDLVNGLYNGQRMLIQIVKALPSLLVCTLLNDPTTTVFVPKIKLAADHRFAGFRWYRLQFPVIPAYALTINKSQGQSVDRAAVYLQEQVFAHGMLYTSGTRCRRPACMRFFLHPSTVNRARNIVYHEVLER